jgi:hypothetical protein
LTGTSNAGVTNSSSIASCVALILLNLSNVGCKATIGGPNSNFVTRSGSAIQQNQPTPQPQDITSEERTEMAKHPFVLAPQRMSVKSLGSTVPLGNPVDLTLTFAPGKLVGTIDVAQRDESGPLVNTGGPAKVVSDHGLTKTIEITPMQIGPLDIQVSANYLDNAYVEQTIHLDVVASKSGLKTFSLDEGIHTMRIRLDGDKYERDKRLTPVVTYEGVTTPIYLSDCSQIKLSVKQDMGSPIISVDKQGTIHALHEGKANLIGDFDGVEDQIQLTIYSNTNPHPE